MTADEQARMEAIARVLEQSGCNFGKQVALDIIAADPATAQLAEARVEVERLKIEVSEQDDDLHQHREAIGRLLDRLTEAKEAQREIVNGKPAATSTKEQWRCRDLAADTLKRLEGAGGPGNSQNNASTLADAGQVSAVRDGNIMTSGSTVMDCCPVCHWIFEVNPSCPRCMAVLAKPSLTGQSRCRSALEAVTNVAIGYGISIAAQLVILPMLRHPHPVRPER